MAELLSLGFQGFLSKANPVPVKLLFIRYGVCRCGVCWKVSQTWESSFRRIPQSMLTTRMVPSLEIIAVRYQYIHMLVLGAQNRYPVLHKVRWRACLADEDESCTQGPRSTVRQAQAYSSTPYASAPAKFHKFGWKEACRGRAGRAFLLSCSHLSCWLCWARACPKVPRPQKLKLNSQPTKLQPHLQCPHELHILTNDETSHKSPMAPFYASNHFVFPQAKNVALDNDLRTREMTTGSDQSHQSDQCPSLLLSPRITTLLSPGTPGCLLRTSTNNQHYGVL